MEAEIKAPTSLREYLRGTKEAADVFRWIYREVVTTASKKWLKRLFFAQVMMMIMQTVQPGAVSYVINGLMDHNGTLTFWAMASFLVALLLTKLFQRGHDRAREFILGIHWHSIDDKLTELFFGKSLAQHAHLSDTLSPTSIEKGKGRVNDLQRTLLFEGVPVVLQLVISFVCLCFLNFIAGMGMLLVIFIYVGCSLYLNSIIAKACIPLDKRFREIGRRRSERFECVERVGVCGKEKVEVQEMSGIFGNIINDDRGFWLRLIDLAYGRSFLNAVGLVAVMSWGVWLVWNGKLNIGMLYPLFAWSQRVSENIWRFGDIELHINWNLPPIKSMIKAVQLPPEIVDKPDAIEIDPKQTHEITLDGVSHAYPNEDENTESSEPAIKNISFSIAPGEKVAIIGGSGSGKSTMMKKVLRFGDPTAGRILIDGIDLRDIKLASWRHGIGYIAQQSQVFDGTIRMNLTYGMTEKQRAETTDEDLWRLMRLLQIDFGKERLTQGLDTVVGKNGVKLSGGQSQRLMIGAAVAKNPWLMIIDEATSSLDSTTEKSVQKGLEAVLSNKRASALVIAHRLNTVRNLCDKFVVLKAAKDVANGESQVEAIAGSFEELYLISPTFRQLADDQDIKIDTRSQVEAEVGMCA